MSDAPASPRLRVVTFNVRCGTAHDGDNDWTHRRTIAAGRIAALSPEVAGLQECHAFQANDLLAALPQYRMIGVGREDGVGAGEMCAILYRADRLHVVVHGHFWLSETPDVPGSRSWGSAWVRMCTWIALRPIDRPDALFHVFNTHLDNESATAREQGARLIRARIDALGPDVPALLIGDFNAPADPAEPPYAVLVDPLARPRLTDVYRQHHPHASPDENTFHAFTGQPTGPRIDWILATRHWSVGNAWIDRTHDDGRYPSDHFPVIADLMRCEPRRRNQIV